MLLYLSELWTVVHDWFFEVIPYVVMGVEG